MTCVTRARLTPTSRARSALSRTVPSQISPCQWWASASRRATRGTRSVVGGGAPRRSLFGLWFSNTVLRRLGGARLKDSQAGFRAYPLAEISGLKLRGTRYDLELEVLIKAAWKGLPLIPIPIQCSYEPEGGRVSHFRPVRDFCQIGLQILRLVVSK